MNADVTAGKAFDVCQAGFFPISVRCTNILVSASSCFTGGVGVVEGLIQMLTGVHWTLDTTAIVLPILSRMQVSHITVVCCVNFWGNPSNFLGSASDNQTTIFTPVPRFCLVCSFKLYFTYLSQNNIKTGSINCCDLFGEMRSKRVRIVLVKCFKFFVLLMSAALSVIKPSHVTRLLAVVSALSGTVSNSSDQTTTCDTVACCVVNIIWHSFQQ